MSDMKSDLPEQKRADALAAVVMHAGRRDAAKARLKDVTADLRKVSVAAIKAGCPYRRVRDWSGVSLQTLVNWVKEDSDD